MAKRKSITGRMDTHARQIIRLRDVVCQNPSCKSGYNLQCAHVAIIRKYYIARWDLLNLLLMCTECHDRFDANRAEGMKWFQEAFPIRFDYLADLTVLKNSHDERTRTWRDRDLQEIDDFLKEKYQELLKET